MLRSHRLAAPASAILAALALLFGASAPSASVPSTATAFDLVSSNVADQSTWLLNHRMEFTFSADVDFSTVNADTIRITDSQGVPAVGEYGLRGARTVLFQPACPTETSLSNSGLQPSRRYHIYLPGADQGGPGLMSTSAELLRLSHTIHFGTPISTDSALLFQDGAAGAPRPVIATDVAQTSACYLELGNDPGNRVYFAPRATPDAELGAETPAGFLSPLNLYSQVSSHVAFVIQLNQSIDASPGHLNAGTVGLEYELAAHDWHPLPHTVSLLANCTPSGAALRVVPLGILPQGHLVRAVLRPGFSDITGDSLFQPVTVGAFPIDTAYDPGTMTQGLGSDEIFEDFLVGGDHQGSLEDTSAGGVATPAIWGDQGKLTAAFAFGGTGGPGGDFDWLIPAGQTLILDTTFSVITNESQTATESVVNGLVDVRNFTVGAGATLILQGPNPCTIRVSGSALILGQILLRGSNNPGVTSINNTNMSELGAAGRAGGGRGGTGNPLTNQSSPTGLPGFGAFDLPNGGGGGGETGYSLGDENTRRPGGGGGGTLGHDVLFPGPNPHRCADQSVIGLDTEAGFGGPAGGNGALHPPGTPPAGGIKGPSPFHDDTSKNDFWGTMITHDGVEIRGELDHPWAGAGGGGGGNACNTTSFPTTPFNVTGDEKGAGGGGGGGSLTILALGDITFGLVGRIDASGGTGGGGENTNNLNHVGGGSGGGSGGHVILQTAAHIDFRLCSSLTNPPAGIYARGGQGGQGFLAQIQDGAGGAQGGFTTTPWLDALPVGYYPNTTAPCGVVPGGANGLYTVANTVGNADPSHVVIGGGGDGGPGLIQLHVPSLANILPPSSPNTTLFQILKPPPVGTTPDNVSGSPLLWDQLLPIFARISQSQSKWIPLGAANVNPTSPARDQVEFLFAGTTNGLVTTTGSGSTAQVADLPAILAGMLASAPATPFIAADQRTVVFDAGLLGDDIYKRNAALVQRFDLRLIQAGTAHDFEVGAASYDATLDQLRVTVTASGMPLAPFGPGDAVELRPRFFRVSTDGTLESLPASSQVTLEFQATVEDAAAGPDAVQATPWVTDIAQLNQSPNYRFIRFRVSFDIGADNAPLSPFTPVPSLEFFRIPFKF